MKPSIRAVFGHSFVILLSLTLGCKPKAEVAPCTTQDENRSVSVNAFDGNPTSTNYQKVFAVLQFKQKATSYTGLGCNGKILECSNNLAIQNTTNKTIKFDINVQFSLNAVSWNYQNFVTINPNSTLDLGVINSNCTSISLGRIQVSGTGVTYQ